MSFPHEGELFKAQEKKSEHLVFFAHFFKGHKKALRRHIEFVNQLGYDAYAFNLLDDLKDHQYLPYSHKSKKFGMKHAIADQIEDHLHLLTDYRTKIIFAFSNVAGAAVEAMVRRDPFDSIGLICDSGPGGNLIYSSYHLLEHQMGVTSIPFKLLGAPLVVLGWSSGLHQDISADLKKLPDGFPVLSIRGWKDPMISPKQIDELFEPATQLNWRKLALPEAGHINGLRDFPDDYRAGVSEFLKSIN